LEQEAATAYSVKGEFTELPFAGLYTVTAASAGTAATRREEERARDFRSFMKIPSEMDFRELF